MALKKRQTLINYFRAGNLPTEEHFTDLIESTLNIVDDGFSKSRENGFHIAAMGNYDGLLSFRRDNAPNDPVWSVTYVDGTNKLCFRSAEAEQPALTLSVDTEEDRTEEDRASDRTDPGARIGVNRSDPVCALDVAGVVKSEGRIGANAKGFTTVPADGAWHDVAGPLDGCHAFEVMAGVGQREKGRYALMRAYAHNAFNPRGWFFNFLCLKRRIRYDQSYFRSMSDKIRLRWTGDNHGYRLQLKTNSAYDDGIVVRFYLTRLWFDPLMAASRPEAESESQ